MYDTTNYCPSKKTPKTNPDLTNRIQPELQRKEKEEKGENKKNRYTADAQKKLEKRFYQIIFTSKSKEVLPTPIPHKGRIYERGMR